MKSKSHTFVVKVAFNHSFTRREALAAVKDSGQFGLGALDYYFVQKEPFDASGEMKITRIKHA